VIPQNLQTNSYGKITGTRTTLKTSSAADWDDSETSLAQFSKNNSTGDSTKPADEQLWEDNWDEDDVEDEFSKQLREELAKTSAAAQPATTTDTVMS